VTREEIPDAHNFAEYLAEHADVTDGPLLFLGMESPAERDLAIETLLTLLAVVDDPRAAGAVVWWAGDGRYHAEAVVLPGVDDLERLDVAMRRILSIPGVAEVELAALTPDALN
jgi:hypothetical protein